MCCGDSSTGIHYEGFQYIIWSSLYVCRSSPSSLCFRSHIFSKGVIGWVLFLTTIEAITGLMCACFPALWPLIKGYLGHGASPNTSFPSSEDTPVSHEPKPPRITAQPLSYPSAALQNIMTRDTYASTAENRSMVWEFDDSNADSFVLVLSYAWMITMIWK